MTAALRRFGSKAIGSRREARRWSFRPLVEALEYRLAPAGGVFTVTTLADDGSAGSLRGAVNAADKFIGAAQIVFAVNGVFKLTQFNAPGTPSPNTGDIDITNNISFIGNGVQQTIIDANGIDRAFWISGPLTVNFNDLTVRNGVAGPNSTGATAGVTGSEGGAVYAATAGASLNFTNVVLTGNRAGSNGGAIASESAAVNITNGYIASNQAIASGGAIAVDTGAAVTITNSHLELNTAGHSGGAIFIGTNVGTQPTLTITGSLLNNNHADDDGGAIDDSSTTGGGVTLFNTTLINNTASSGGAIWTSGDINIDGNGGAPLGVGGRNNIGFNSGFEDGGAIYQSANGGAQPTMSIANTNLSANRAGSTGGAIFVSASKATLTNVLMVVNSARFNGGAIADGFVTCERTTTNAASGDAINLATPTTTNTLTITASVLNNNTAGGSGGAVYTQVQTTVADSRLDFNVAGFLGGSITAGAVGGGAEMLSASPFAKAGTGGAGGAIADIHPFESVATLTVTNCDIDNNTVTGSGGGIYTSSSTANLGSNRIVGNTATHKGGGVSDTGSGGAVETTLSVTNSQIIGNKSLSSSGGGVFVGSGTGGNATFDHDIVNANVAQGTGGILIGAGGGGLKLSVETAVVTNSTIHNNTAVLHGGGGVAYDGGGMLTVGGSVVTNNTTNSDGGGIYFENGTALVLTGNLISANAAGNSGGGVYDGAGPAATGGGEGGGSGGSAAAVSRLLVSSDTLPTHGGALPTQTPLPGASSTLIGNADTISLNTAGLDGGGIWTKASTVTFTPPGLGSLFSGNRAGRNGGGLFRTYEGTPPDTSGTDTGAKLTNVTFAANVAGSQGGAVFSQYGASTAGGSASLVLMNDTLNLNAAGKGSAILVNNLSTGGGSASTVTITNSIVAGAPPGAGPDLATSGPGTGFGTKADGSNLTDNPNNLTVNGGLLSGTAANNVGLGPLQDNGGPTFTFLLLPNSPAINNALADQSPADGVPNADQRGVLRPQPQPGGTVDIGAVEVVLPDQFIVAAPTPGSSGGPVTVNVYQATPTNAGPPPLVGTVSAGDFTGGVTLALADVNDDGVPDLIVGSGPGQAPLVEVFSLNKTAGTFGTRIGSKIVPFDTAFQGGVYVAGGQFNFDRHADVVVAAGPGGGPEVKVYSLYQQGGDTLTTPFPIPIQGTGVDGGWLAFPPNFTSGVAIAVSDVNGDGQDDVVAAQATFGGTINVFDGTNVGHVLIPNLLPFGTGFAGGLSVAGVNLQRQVGGVFLPDIFGDIIVGQAGGGGAVRLFDGDTHVQVGNQIFPFTSAYTGGVNVASVQDINANSSSEIIAGQATGQGQIKVIDSSTLAFLDTFFANTAFTNGVFVGGGF